MLTRPRRQVVQRPTGYSVEPGMGRPYVTGDEAHAAHVAAEFDRLDPLPYPEHDCTEETFALMSYSSTEPIGVVCKQCGERV